MIADSYNWVDMHHIHAMARVHHTGALVEESVYGSLFILPMLKSEPDDNFDYLDSVAGQSVLIQVGDICIIAVLNDSSMSRMAYSHIIDKIAGRLTKFQSKELFARLTHVNMNLKKRPLYSSGLTKRGYEINTENIPEAIELLHGEEEYASMGKLFYRYIHHLIPLDTPDRNKMLQHIMNGNTVTFSTIRWSSFKTWVTSLKQISSRL